MIYALTVGFQIYKEKTPDRIKCRNPQIYNLIGDINTLLSISFNDEVNQ